MERNCVICEDETTFHVQFEWLSVPKVLIFGVYSVWFPCGTSCNFRVTQKKTWLSEQIEIEYANFQSHVDNNRIFIRNMHKKISGNPENWTVNMNISLGSYVSPLHCVLLSRKNWYLDMLLTMFWRKYCLQLELTDGGSKFHRNVAKDLSDYRVSYNEIPKFKSSQAWNVKSSVTTTLRGNFCASYLYGILRKKFPGQLLRLFTSDSFRFFPHSHPNVALRLPTIKFANSPTCACRGSTGQKP